MQHIYNLWEQLLYKCLIMKNSVLGKIKQKQSTVHNHGPCVYKHARSHMTNTLFSQSKPVSLLMSLYIYLYFVKNKLHNSTNLENCFFKLKMTKTGGKKRKTQTKHYSAIKHTVSGHFVWGGRISTKLKEWGDEGEKYKTSLSPHLQILLHSSPVARKKTKKGGEGNIHSFRKQFYVTYKWKKGGWGRRIIIIQIPNNILLLDGAFL